MRVGHHPRVIEDDCFVCDKHRRGDAAEGGVLYRDEDVYVGHIHALGHDRVYRGYLMVEPVRHVAGWGDLTDGEAEAIGRMVNRVAGALLERLGAEHVYTFVFGDDVPHLHVHVVPRYPGTPREFWGTRLGEWVDAPTVDPTAMASVIERLRPSVTER